jgi:hypothetical protein
MKKLLLVLSVPFLFWSCSETSEKAYSGKKVDVALFQSSTYDYKGNLEIRELVNGSLEWTLRLDGAKSYSEVSFPAHLHFGSYDQPNAPLAQVLTPVSSQNLNSVTLLGPLSNGATLRFDDLLLFDGHVKVHLASEGPDYGVILVAGNLGSKAKGEFDPTTVALCGNSF